MSKGSSAQILLSLLLLASGHLRAQTVRPQPTLDPPKPLLLVSFERQAIKEKDAIQVRVWFTNEWDQSLSNVTLHVDSPATLKWNATTCEQWKQNPNELWMVNQSLDLGSVGPNEVRPAILCVQSGPSIDVGDFNILFAADYSWNKNSVVRHSLVTNEKPLKANLFGSDTVAGVPIALAAFIVPGLFFWLVLGWFKFPLSIGGLGLGDKLIYSVLTSLPLLWIVNWLKPDPNAGISFGKLSFYAITGLSTGFVIGIVAWGWRWKHGRSMARERLLLKEKEIKFGDTPQVLLGKLLNIYPGYHKPRAVLRTAAGDGYEGSLATETEEVVAIVGWFQIDQAKIIHQDKAAIVAELKNANRPIDLFNLAVKYGLQLEGRNPIRVGGKDIKELGFTNPRKDADTETFDGQSPEEPLILV